MVSFVDFVVLLGVFRCVFCLIVVGCCFALVVVVLGVGFCVGLICFVILRLVVCCIAVWVKVWIGLLFICQVSSLSLLLCLFSCFNS